MRTAAVVIALVMVAACAVDEEGSTTSAAAGADAGGELGTGGAIAGGVGGADAGGELGTGGAGVGGAQLGGQLAAAPTVACPVAQVAGTACSTNGYTYLPDDLQHWCVLCYEWTPPAVHPPVNSQSACLGQLASLPNETVQCVASCAACLPCPSGVACVHP